MTILKLVISDTCLCDKCFLKHREVGSCDEIYECPLNDKEYLIELTPEEYEMFKSNSYKKSSISRELNS